MNGSADRRAEEKQNTLVSFHFDDRTQQQGFRSWRRAMRDCLNLWRRHT